MYRTAFDLGHGVPWHIVFPALFGCLLIAVGVLLLRVSQGHVPEWFAEQAEQLHGKRPIPKWTPWLWLAFSVAACIPLVVVPARDYWKLRQALTTGATQSVDGIVEDFVPAAERGKGSTESFTVNGVAFSYDRRTSNAFHHVRVRGGPVREGLAVRVTYLADGGRNAILRLEIDKDEPESAASSSRSSHLPLEFFVPVWLALGALRLWLFTFNKNIALRRRLHAPLLIGLLLTFFGFVSQAGALPWPFYLFGLYLGSAGVLRVAFCDCGKTVQAKRHWARPSECDKCGAPITARHRPWPHWP